MDNHHEELNKTTGSEQTFVPPRHWIGPEELQASYWSDPQIQEQRAQEFYEKPVEMIDQIDRVDSSGFARRDFLTVMGASMAMASISCARRPVHKIIPYVVKPEEVTLGVPNWYASTCQECSVGCGVLVKNREGRPIKLEGNPDHPINQGALCTRGQASLLNLYDPDRLKAPVVHLRGNGSRKELTWQEADTAIQSQLKGVLAKGGRVRVLTGVISGDSTRRLVREFLSNFKSGENVEFEPLHLEEIADAQELTYGTSVVPRYRFEEAEVVLSLGADFLTTWLSPVEYARGWAKKRKLNGQNPAHAKLSRLVCFESMLTVTGANADERYPIRPGDELKIALALAHILVVQKKYSRFATDSLVQSSLSEYQPEKIASEIGLEGGHIRLERLAEELWKNRGKSLIVGGSVSSKTRDAFALQIAVNLLNSILENEGVTVDGTLQSGVSHSSYASLARLASEMQSGLIDVLVIHQSNPLYVLPHDLLGFEGAMKRVPLIISISDREDETALLADYVLPDHHYLENWGDAHPQKGLYSLQQPSIAPLHSTRAFQESLLIWSKALGGKGLVQSALDWHGYLQQHWKETVFRDAGSTATFEQFWESVLRVGVYSARAGKAKPAIRLFRSASLNKLPHYTPLTAEISLVLYSKPSMDDGRSANNAWLQEKADPISSVTWDNYLNIGPALAKKLNVAQDDVVELQSEGVRIQVPVHLQPGLHSHVVSVAVGYGRRSTGKVGNQAGVDVYPFLQVADQRLIFSGRSVQVRKTGKFYRLAATQWHTVTENRPVINDITLSEFRKNPAAALHTDPHLRLKEVPTIWPKHEYKSYRWGMAIDLNSCTGCGACVIACQAENNIPVVGREQVRNSRHMSWIKIDRYYSGSPDAPELVFQPMLCQHCENAPCETVCPVLATVHDDEGLNVQVYNRCVGTRYCQNNCPYKVRRFNFFDHWKSYEGTMNLAWNPDVTVRTRGIMEKCTFCVQRIRDAKDKAKDAGEKVRDGDFQTACQQTCPTEAIIFGNINDPESRVSKWMASPHAFKVLEVVNTLPSISYMTKVRNQDKEVSRRGE